MDNNTATAIIAASVAVIVVCVTTLALNWRATAAASRTGDLLEQIGTSIELGDKEKQKGEAEAIKHSYAKQKEQQEEQEAKQKRAEIASRNKQVSSLRKVQPVTTLYFRGPTLEQKNFQGLGGLARIPGFLEVMTKPVQTQQDFATLMAALENNPFCSLIEPIDAHD